jgi:hypothetical protein
MLKGKTAVRLALTGLLAMASAIPVAASPASAANPLIQDQSCTSGRATWVHIYFYAGTHCYGFKGLVDLPDFGGGGYNAQTVCFGNNYGVFWYDQNGHGYRQNFVSGEVDYFGSNITPTALEINGWSGSSNCNGV